MNRRFEIICSVAAILVLAAGCSDAHENPLLPHPAVFDLAVNSLEGSIDRIDQKVATYHAAGQITNDGVAGGLRSLLTNAREAAIRGDVKATENMMGAFANRVRAQRGKHIATVAADELAADAQRVIDGDIGGDVPTEADLSVALEAAERITAGEELTLTVTVGNAGPAAARDLQVSLLVAGSVDGVAAPPGCTPAATGTDLLYDCGIASLDASGEAVLTFVVIATEGGDTLSGQADIVDWSDAEDPEVGNNIATGSIYVNGAPFVSIALPSAGSIFLESGEVRFQGAAEDLEDGPITGEDLVWTSDLSGPLGTGETLILSGLAAGEHSITLSATDADGALASAAVQIDVVAAGTSQGASLNWELLLKPVADLHTTLTGVWEISPNDVWAVGNACGLGRRIILHWDGTEWREEPHGSTCPTAVWASASDDVFVVAGAGRIRHFDGTTWTDHETGVTATLSAVWGSGPSDVWAAGEGMILHYDGNAEGRWTTQLTSAEVSTTLRLFSLWGTSSDNVYAAGPNGNLWNYDGTQWSRVSTGFNPGHLWGVWGSGPDDVFAVGSWGMIAHWNGSTWTQQTAPAELTTETLYGVSGSGSGDVHAVGTSGTIIRYDGASWRRVAAGGPTIRAISATRPDATFAVGSNAFVLEARGDRWKVHSANVTFDDVWAAASDEVFVVGADGYNNAGLLLHYDGSDWTLQHTDLTSYELRASRFRALWGSSASDVWAVGEQGRMVHYDGTRWTRQESGTTQHLEGVWGTGSGTVFVVGSGGTILEHDGSAWRAHTAPVASSLQDVFGASDDAVWAVGSGGTVLRYDGESWTTQRTGTEMLYAGWAIAPNLVFVASSSSTILRWDGAGWTAAPAPSLARGLWGSSPTDVFAAANHNKVLHFDGAGWTAQETPARFPCCSNLLTGIWGLSPTEVFAVGGSGMVVRGMP